MNPRLAAVHRAAFMEAMDGGVAIVPAGGERVRNRDVHYRFRPESDFWYLTAFGEPDAIAVLRPHADRDRYVLFVRPSDPALEQWNGKRAGVDGARATYGADAAFPIEAFDAELPKLLRGCDKVHYATGADAALDQRVLGTLREAHVKTRDGVRLPRQIHVPGTLLHELRLRKSADEIAVLRRAAQLTDRAHRAAMSALRAGLGEWEIEALVEGAFRAGGGWGPGYPSICASGANATILHYNTNNERVPKGALMLLDAGGEVDGYTADVTRCFPESGHFSGAQRELYEIVLAANLAGIAQVAPGNTFASVHEAALKVLVAGLIDLELLSGSVEEQLASEAYRRWYMHRTSHWLGLDVHDVGSYHDASGASRRLEPGMVLTVEPGLYVLPDDERAPERLRGLGVRIEDDVLVTETGREVLTAAIPKTIADVEAAC